VGLGTLASKLPAQVLLLPLLLPLIFL